MEEKIGLIIGKFYPIHKGHVSIIEKASKDCDKLYVELQYMKTEQAIPLDIRKNCFY